MTEPVTDAVLDDVANSVAESGSYELICNRLKQQAMQLEQQVQTLNTQRTAEFGKSDFVLEGRARIRTEHNCIPRDIVRIGDYLLFGYNVFLGLKQHISVSDVFSLHRLVQSEQGFDFENAALDETFLQQAGFLKDFQELYTYYKQTRLIQLRVLHDKLLAAFQIGERYTDVRVFRWNIQRDGHVEYIDNRGDKDFVFPATHDFEWQRTQREQHVAGVHPHINIHDKVFVETVGGDLTFKVENNTEEGEGIYNEPVDDKYQTLEDAEIYYADLGSLILFKIRPFREDLFRYFIYNHVLQDVVRVDRIADCCVQLPEEQGVIYPGGYYLTNGQGKSFDGAYTDMLFKRILKSPNGKDLLYLFYQPEQGLSLMMAYDVIEKTIQTPLESHGVGWYENGRLVLFKAENEPTRVHPVQIWQTPFTSDEFHAAQPVANTPLAKIGNTELVKGIAELFGLCRDIQQVKATQNLYEQLIKRCQTIQDNFYWLDAEDIGQFGAAVKQIRQTAEQVLDEFEKVRAIQAKAQQALLKAHNNVKTAINSIYIDSWHDPLEFVDALSALRQQKGALLSLKDMRYMDIEQVDALFQQVAQWQEKVAAATVAFLQQPEALQRFDKILQTLEQRIAAMEKVIDLKPLLDEMEQLGQGVGLVTDIVSELQVDDPTIRAQLLDNITEVFSRLNQLKASASHKVKSLRSNEAVAEFSSQFKLLEQSVSNALSSVTSPVECDDQLSKVLLSLESLESRFNEFEQFIADIAAKREDIYSAFESVRQRLVDERQRRSQAIAEAAFRIIGGIAGRVKRLSQSDELNTYLASDPMLMKLQDMIQQLRDLDDSVRADDVEAKFKAEKEQAIRGLRDKQDIFEQGGQVIKLGQHRFSVNSQNLDLTLVHKDDLLQFHLVGTDFWAPIRDPQLMDMSAQWTQMYVSETSEVARAEYLVYAILDSCEQQANELSWPQLKQAMLSDAELLALVRKFMTPRYQEGYVKGIHDHDAAKLLQALLPIREAAGLLYFPAQDRAWALLFFVHGLNRDSQLATQIRAQSALRMLDCFGDSAALLSLQTQLSTAIQHFLLQQGWPELEMTACEQAADYLSRAIAEPQLSFTLSRHGDTLYQAFFRYLEQKSLRLPLEEALQSMQGQLFQQWEFLRQWVQAFTRTQVEQNALYPYWPEVALRFLLSEQLSYQISQVPLQCVVEGLLSEHARIQGQTLPMSLDGFTQRLKFHHQQIIPKFRQFIEYKQSILVAQRHQLRLDSFKPKPLTTFVRNKLINEVYLPIIGDNLAKQMGTVGENKRTDLMGLLLLISPPGYGKTTLMEYVASRLGLVFMKINCPSVGHEVTSLDSTKAPNSTAEQELNKLNLALEMGNNVMLYLDDIQHTNPEFLQKFISLCDGTRRIEGVWQGQSKTYDMRGKKFCVVMAGNPYTESGDVFKVPDMLANRADIYNLGDVLSGKESVFELSYLENCLSANAVLSPLALRPMQDVYHLIGMAQGQNIAQDELSYDYSAAERTEIIAVLKHLLQIQSVVLRVNQQYIASASQADAYRTEPPFKLQGSYRNMAKMAEKVVAVMTPAEVEALIDDHYIGEAQTLTVGAEENLLKLAELRGTLSGAELQRWQAIKQEFVRRQSLGGDDSVGMKVVNQLSQLTSHLGNIATQSHGNELTQQMAVLSEHMQALLAQNNGRTTHIEVVNQPVPGMDQVLQGLSAMVENSLLPVVSAMEHKIRMDHDVWNKVKETAQILQSLQQTLQNIQYVTTHEHKT